MSARISSSVRRLATASPVAADLREWASLRALGRKVDSPIDLEYWKSIPYFASFMDGYKSAERVKTALDGPEATEVGRAACCDAIARSRPR